MRCIGRGRPSSSGAGRGRCGCSRRRRRRRRERSWGRGGSRPTIVTAPRWSSSLARAQGGRRRVGGRRVARRRSRTVVSWCSRSSRCGSGCTISSTRSRPGCRPGGARTGAARWRLDRAGGAGLRGRFAGRPPSVAIAEGARRRPSERRDREVLGRRAGRDCLPPPPDAELRAARLGRDLQRWRRPARADIAFVDGQIEQLLADSAGQILTTLPGVATTRAAAFAAHTLPIERFATPEHLYSATGLAPASYKSATVRRRGGISRTGLPEHRDALIGIAWGLGQYAPAFQAAPQRTATPAARHRIEARVALARHACRLCWRMLKTQEPYDDRRYDRARRDRGR